MNEPSKTSQISSADAASIQVSDTYNTFGSSSQLWGETWTDDDINSPNFGFVLAVLMGPAEEEENVVSVDHVRITVHYTEGASGPTAAQSSAGFFMARK